MENKNYQDLCNEVKKLGKKINESGSVLYSPIDTLSKGKFYLLGINPGGSDFESIDDQLKKSPGEIKSQYNTNWSESKDNTEYRTPLQTRIISLFKNVADIDKICASNLIFFRSKSEEELRKNDVTFRDMEEMCWPVHQFILKIVDPEVIITFGKSPYLFVSEMLQMEELPGKSMQAGHSTWKIRIGQSRNGEPKYIIGFPHFSRYEPKENILKGILDVLGHS